MLLSNETFQSEEITCFSGLISLYFVLNIYILLCFRKTSRLLVCLLLKYQHSNNQAFESMDEKIQQISASFIYVE